LPSFGEKLKQERTKRAVTLDQISQTTKIGTRMLQALEEERFNQLPGGIFNKGFVRAYARCIGMDEDQAVADYLEASGEAPPPKPALQAEAITEMQPEERRRESPPRELPWGWFAALLLIVALALSFWSYRKREHREPPARHVASTAPAVRSPQPDVAPASANANPATRAASSGSAATPQAPPSAPAGGFAVLIQAREDSWVSIVADGNPVGSTLLIAGTERTVHARKEVVIRAGNAGALDLSFNGRKLPSQGGYGEVKTLTFSPGGLVPTPQSQPPTQ